MKSKKQIIIQLLGLLIFISSPFLLNASHIIGGKITYRFLGSNKYEIKLTVYRDCADLVDFDNPAPITIFDNSTNAIISNNQLGLYHRDTIHPNNPDPCFIPPAGICVEEGYYLDTVLLPANTSGYTATYQRCCHNSSILNIITPSFNGTTITTNIPPQINNSAVFLNFPPIYICVNDTFNYSFACTDIDGDSLVYQMCTPLSGITTFSGQPNPAYPPPYIPITWSNSFSATNPVVTSNGVNFNSNTGAISFVPTIQGQYAVGICALEYRNGILINTNRLEVQFNVVPCYLVSSIPTATNLCVGLGIQFQNGSTNATSYHWDFGVTSITSDTSNLSSPSYTYPAFGTYSVSLVAINSSYGSCKDTTIKVINVNPLLAPSIPSNYLECYKNNNVSLNVGGVYDNSATFNWNFGNNAIPNTSTINNPVAHFDTITQNISVIVSQFGCSDTLHSTVDFINPIPAIPTTTLNCNGSNLTFHNQSSNATHVFWDFGVPTLTTDTSSQNNPNYIYPMHGIFTITLIAYNGTCSDTVTTQISVSDTLSLNPINNVETQCLKNNSFNFFANGNYSPTANFYWQFYGSSNTTTLTVENPTNVTYTLTGNHIVNLMVSENGCSTFRQQVIKILPSPKASFTTSDTVGCQPLQINFINQSISTIPYIVSWEIENNFFNINDTNYIFNNSGLYSVAIIISDTNNCSDTLDKINYINVYPKPKAIAMVNPKTQSILNPDIDFIDNTINTHTTNFNFGDNTTSNQKVNNHSYTETGNYNYQLIVVNNFGCSDTTNGVVIIEPFNALFIPNSFTPNNDDLNDTFKPVIPYYKTAFMQIFNRWGALLYSTEDIQNGWNGTYKNARLPNDVYIYKISVEFLDGKTENKNGTVTLIR